MVHHGAVPDDLGPREGGHSPRNKVKTVGTGWSRAFRPVLALFLVWVVAAAGRAETPSPLPGTNRPVSRAAGPFVWDEPVAGGGRGFRDAIDLPVLPWPEMCRLRPDPQDPEGVILTLFDRGVAFLTYAE